MSAAHSRWTVEQIADHEEYHAKAEMFAQSGLNEQLRQRIVETMGEEQLREALDAYTARLAWMEDVPENVSDEELDRLAAKAEAEVLEEMLADAYAGINRYEGHAERFEATVNDFMNERYIGKEYRNEAATMPDAVDPVRTDTGQTKYLEDDSGVPERYAGRNLSEDGGLYTYEFLTSLPDMNVVTLPDVGELRRENGKIEQSDIASRGIENALSVGTERAGKVYVTNRYTGHDLWVTASSVRHSLNGTANRILTNARLGAVIGEMVQNAVPVNALRDTANDVTGTYAMAGYATDRQGREFVAVITVEQRTNSVAGVEVFDVVHAVSGRQKRDKLKDGSSLTLASSGGNQVGTKPQGVNPIKVSSEISIADLLESVKDVYQSVLSESVLGKLGATRNPDGYYSNRVKFLEDDEEISQERIDAMGRMMDEKIMADQKAIGRELQARDQRKAKAEARRMEKNRERAQKLKETRKRLLDEARATLAKEPARKTAAPENKLTAQKPIFAKRDVREAIFREFHIRKGERGRAGNVIEGYLNEVLERGYLEDGDLRNLMDRLIDLGVVEFEADEIMAEGRIYLKGNRIYVSESLRREFGDDWRMIQKKAFALGVFLTNDKKFAGVDVWWQDMAGYLPGMVDVNETDQRTMLERLLWIAAEGKAEKMSLAEYTKMLADQEHQSEAELLDSMAQNLGQILRQFGRDAKLEMRMREYTKNAIDRSREKNDAYTKKAVDRQRLYRLAEKAHYREHLQNMRNRKELNKLQDRTLKMLQWLKRNRNRAPEELRAQIEEVLGNIDLFAIGAANELNWHPKYQMTWRDIVDVYKAAKAKAQKGEIGFIKDPELERIVDRLDKDKIADLDIGALNDLFNAAVCLRKKIFDADKLLSDENGKRLDGVYTEMVGEMEQSKAIGKGTIWDKFFNTQQLTPMNVLRQMGGWRPDGAWARMAKLLEKGEQDVRAYKVKAARILEDYLNDHAEWIHKADGQGKDGIWIRKEVPQLEDIGLDGGATFGDTVEIWMTPIQRVHLYLESKNEDNLRHMVGGRTFVDKELYSKGKRDEAFAAGVTVKLAPETVKALVSDLTPEELELARLLDSYYNGMAHDEINRVSMTLYGYNKAMGKNYAPIFTNSYYTNSEAGIFDQTAEGVGNLKERLHAGNPSRNISALDAFERNVDKTALFVGMAIPARDWNSLMNWRAGEHSMREQIGKHWGDERVEYIEKGLLVDLQGGTPTKPDVVQEAADKLLSNYISSIFGFNPSIVLKQAGSLPLAAAYLGGENMSLSMFKKERRDRDFIAKYTQELAWRSMGYAMPETRQLKEKPSALREGGKKVVSAALKPLDYLPKFGTTQESRDQFAEDAFGGGYITKMDEGVASILWAWAENKVQKEFPDLEVGDQKTIDEGRSPFYQKVAEEFNTAVSHSQSVSDVAHQSTMRRSKNVVTRTFTMFRSDSAQTYNALRQMWGEKAYYEKQAKRYAESDSERAKELKEQAEKAAQAAGKRVGTVVIATACNAILAECINLAMAAIKGKLGQYEDEEEEELTVLSVLSEMGGGLIESTFGIVTFGDFAAEAIGRLVTGKSGYAEEAPGLEQLVDLVDRIETAARGARKGDVLGAVREVGMAFSTYFAGFPAENLEKYLITGIAKHLVPDAVAGYEDALEAPAKADLKGMTGIALEVRLGNVLKEYGIDTDGEMRQELARLYEAGQTDAVPSETPTSVKVDGVEKTLSKQMQKVYDQTRSGILNRELGEVMASPFWEDADDKTRAKMLGKLYDYAAEKAKTAAVSGYAPSSATPAEWDEIAEAGGSIADCAVFKTVTGEIGDEPAMKNWEKADLLLDWDGTDAVKELMFRHLITESQEDELAELKKVKVNTDQFLELYAKYGEIDARELTAEQKATEFAYWLDGQRYNDTQKATIKAQMEFRTSLVVEATKYNRAVAAGVDREDALELVENIKALEPPEGKDDPTNAQKWRVAIDESVSESNQLMRLKAVGMQDATYAKVEAAYNIGIAPAAYVRAEELKAEFNEDGKGDLKNDEWTKLIDSMCPYGIVLPGDTKRFSLTEEQKGFLWQMLTGNKSTANNPYSKSGGEKWLAVKENMKAE